jgi:lipopolysaccharide transport system ATP-binding protein
MIRLCGVGLERRTREEHDNDLKARIFALATGRYRRPRKRVVLDDIDLEIRRGEKVGIIGPNGAGKSTLLKVICGVLTPTTGTVDVSGRVAPLLELGAGFDSELPVVDNIILYGVLLGIDKRVIISRVDSILRFAELDEYRTYPIRSLSSGMLARLGFAIATEIAPDILLIDEALSVGDESFRAKSRARIDEMWHGERTVVLVSHDLTLVQSLCERAIWINRGRIVESGDPKAIVEHYIHAVDEAAVAALLREYA